jgi:chromobox protein 1
VKWQGYESAKDRTWEPETNMYVFCARSDRMTPDKYRAGAVDVLQEYFEEIGGRPQPPTAGQKRKGRASGVKSESGTPASSVKRVKQEKAWSPPPGSWEHDVAYIDTVEERQDPKTGTLDKFAYLVWVNDKKTQHPLKHVYQKCPQKVPSHCNAVSRNC